MMLLLVAGVITIDLVTSSSLRSSLIGRLDEQIDASQNQTYTYISQVYKRDLKAGDRTPVTHPGKWLAELSMKAPRKITGAPAPDPRPRPGAPPGAAGPAHHETACVRHEPRPLLAREPVHRRSRRGVTGPALPA